MVNKLQVKFLKSYFQVIGLLEHACRVEGSILNVILCVSVTEITLDIIFSFIMTRSSAKQTAWNLFRQIYSCGLNSQGS